MTNYIPPRIPYAPLAATLEARGGTAAVMNAAGLARDTRAWEAVEKAIAKGLERGLLSVYMADRIAVVILGVHPCLIWGDDWWCRPDDEPNDRTAA